MSESGDDEQDINLAELHNDMREVRGSQDKILQSLGRVEGALEPLKSVPERLASVETTQEIHDTRLKDLEASERSTLKDKAIWGGGGGLSGAATMEFMHSIWNWLKHS